MSKLIFVAIVVSAFFGAAVDAKLSKTSALRQAIFYGYDPLVKPDEKITVKFGISLLNLELCPHKQVNSVPHWATAAPSLFSVYSSPFNVIKFCNIISNKFKFLITVIP
jgi:hypothetical protein